MAKNNLQAEVTEATHEGERVLQITITGAAEDFLLADLLTKRKAIQPITSSLKQAALEATKAYLESAEEVISGAKTEQKKDPPAAAENTGKRGRKSKSEVSEDSLELSAVATNRVNGAATTESTMEI